MSQIETPPHDHVATDPLELHYGKLRDYIGRRVSCGHEAEDLTQETFLRVLNRKRTDAIKEPIRLLFRVARNLLIDRSRRTKTRPACSSLEVESEVMGKDSSPARLTEVREELQTLQRVIDGLPERCQEVFILNRFGGFSYGEIAQRLGISAKTVEKHMARAISACRDALEAK